MGSLGRVRARVSNQVDVVRTPAASAFVVAIAGLVELGHRTHPATVAVNHRPSLSVTARYRSSSSFRFALLTQTPPQRCADARRPFAAAAGAGRYRRRGPFPLSRSGWVSGVQGFWVLRDRRRRRAEKEGRGF